MTLRQAFASALHLFVLFAFIMAGVFLVSLSHLPELKKKILEADLTLVGILFFAAAFLLFWGFFALNSGKYLRVRMNVDIDVKVVHQSIEELFQARKIPLQEVSVTGSKLQITVSMKKEDEEQLPELEKELGILLRQRFGYTKPFYLIVKI